MGKRDFGKPEFLVNFQIIRNQTFKKSTINSIRKNTRLILYNPKVVLQKICTFLRSTWTITSSLPNSTNEISSVYTTTCHRLYEIKNQAYTLINSMRRDS